MSVVCQGCRSFKTFGRKCWFFWESKKSCSQFRKDAKDEPHYQESEPIAVKL
tara:strand:+ start:664 stop:819 length:156 start_codon:yes stop_codon:yes gene_type:complete